MSKTMSASTEYRLQELQTAIDDAKQREAEAYQRYQEAEQAWRITKLLTTDEIKGYHRLLNRIQRGRA